MTTVKILYVLWKIVGLCPFELPENRRIRVSYIGAFYSMILTLLYSICYVNAMKNRLTFHKPRQTPMSLIADIVAKSLESFMVVTTWLSFAFYQNRLKNFQKSFYEIVRNFGIIGFPGVPDNILKNITIQVIFVNFMLTTFYICGYYEYSKSPFYDANVWTAFNFGRIAYPNFSMIFAATMYTMRNYFQFLNDKIIHLSRGNSSSSALDSTCTTNWKKSGIQCLARSDPLGTCILLHSKLVNLTTSIVKFWSLSLYLTMGIYLFELSSSLYDLCLMVKYDKFSLRDESLYFWALIGWFLIHVWGLVAVFVVPESTKNEANRTGSLLHEFFTSNPSNRRADAAMIESLGMLQKPLMIELFGLLDIKLSMIHSIISAVITYITIMIQLDDQQSCKRGFRSKN